jgi:exodeoxyribonuclease V alpha subunit
LTAPDGAYLLPDFTISWKGKTYYWEHLGMLDVENYEKEWEFKKTLYQRNFPGQLITTQESSTLSQETRQIIGSYFGVEPIDEETL